MRLVRGAPGSGRTALVFDEFKQAWKAGRRDLRIVVPTATLVRHFQHELARDGLVFAPGAILSLSRFARERSGQESIPDGLLHAIVRDALRRLDPEEFARVAATDGLAAAVVESIAMLEEAGATPASLDRIRGLDPRSKAFAGVWKAVERAVVERGYATRVPLYRAAAANREKLTVWMDGFLHLNALETELVRSLAQNCDLILTLADSPATDPIRHLAFELGAPDHLTKRPARHPEATLIEAPSIEREVDEIARRVVERRRGGIAFSDIGIALRDQASYLPLLRVAFERFGIPARFYFTSRLEEHPVAAFLRGLLIAALSDWDFETTLNALRAHPAWGTSADFDRFDFKVREAMPGRGAEALGALCDGEALRAFLGECIAVNAWREERVRPDVWQRRFVELAERLYRVRTPDAPADFAAVEAARSHVAGMRGWAEAIDVAGKFWTGAEERIGLADFLDIVAHTLAAARVRIPDNRADVVHVMSVYEARQWDFSELFVCGLTDRDFPRAGKASLIIPEADIARLRSAGIPLRSADDQARDERWLFDSLKSRAAGNLFLSVPAHDSAGRTVERSRYLGEVGAVREAAVLCVPAVVSAQSRSGMQGVLGETLLANLAEQHRTIAISKLESLAQCRFQFFAGRTLALKARPEKPRDRLQARITGLILHDALEKWLAAGRTGDFVEHFEAAFDEACRRHHLPAGYKLEVERIAFREIARKVSASTRWITNYPPAVEVDLSLEFPGGITVTGRVDRIDRLNEHDCVIVDYKAGKTDNVRKLVNSLTSLQGPLYALAVRERMQWNPVAMIFWAVREDLTVGWGSIPGADLELEPIPEGWMEAARTRTIERLAKFLAGDIHPEPTEAEKCRWCDFQATCRYTQAELIQIEAAHVA